MWLLCVVHVVEEVSRAFEDGQCSRLPMVLWWKRGKFSSPLSVKRRVIERIVLFGGNRSWVVFILVFANWFEKNHGWKVSMLWFCRIHWFGLWLDEKNMYHCKVFWYLRIWSQKVCSFNASTSNAWRQVAVRISMHLRFHSKVIFLAFLDMIKILKCSKVFLSGKEGYLWQNLFYVASMKQ